MEYSGYDHSCTDGSLSFPAVPSSVFRLVFSCLDSIADLMFYGALLVRLIPVLWKSFPMVIWYDVLVILLVRLISYAMAAVRYHRFAALHTRLNKLTGGAVFLLPYVLAVSTGVVYSWAVCILAFAAALEELAIHVFRKEYEAI